MQQVSHSPEWTVDAPPVDRKPLVPSGERCHSIFEPQPRTRRLDHASRDLWASLASYLPPRRKTFVGRRYIVHRGELGPSRLQCLPSRSRL